MGLSKSQMNVNVSDELQDFRGTKTTLKRINSPDQSPKSNRNQQFWFQKDEHKNKIEQVKQKRQNRQNSNFKSDISDLFKDGMGAEAPPINDVGM